MRLLDLLLEGFPLIRLRRAWPLNIRFSLDVSDWELESVDSLFDDYVLNFQINEGSIE